MEISDFNVPASWKESIDPLYAFQALQSLARARIEYRTAKAELEECEARMAKLKPRTSYVKVIGVDEETESKIKELRVYLLKSQAALDELQSLVDFILVWKDIHRAHLYNER